MILAAHDTEPYLAEFARFEESLVGHELPALHGTRHAALDWFKDLGFPTPRHEDWKYTNVSPIARTSFKLAESHELDGEEQQRLDKQQKALFGNLSSPILVFVDGHFSEKLSSLSGIPPRVTVGSLSNLINGENALLEPYLARFASFRDNAFVALNTAFLKDGAFLHIPAGTAYEEPIRLLFVSTAGGENRVSHPRALIVAEENSQATIVESYVSLAGGVSHSFTNVVSEAVLGPNARVDHYKVQQEEDTYHISTLQIHQQRDSHFASHCVTLGGLLTRNDVNVRLDGEGCETTLNGLYMVSGHQHVDNHSAVDHAMPHCNSREVYHGILDGSSTGVFNGKIMVRQDAQKTDARQTNRNLLLSEDAVIDTKPQLEIFADDVKCTHGATVGQLDEDAIFYLRARGIPHQEARSLLTHAFASEVLGGIKIEAFRSCLEHLIFEWLSHTHGMKEML